MSVNGILISYKFIILCEWFHSNDDESGKSSLDHSTLFNRIIQELVLKNNDNNENSNSRCTVSYHHSHNYNRDNDNFNNIKSLNSQPGDQADFQSHGPPDFSHSPSPAIKCDHDKKENGKDDDGGCRIYGYRSAIGICYLISISKREVSSSNLSMFLLDLSLEFERVFNLEGNCKMIKPYQMQSKFDILNFLEKNDRIGNKCKILKGNYKNQKDDHGFDCDQNCNSSHDQNHNFNNIHIEGCESEIEKEIDEQGLLLPFNSQSSCSILEGNNHNHHRIDNEREGILNIYGLNNLPLVQVSILTGLISMLLFYLLMSLVCGFPFMQNCTK